MNVGILERRYATALFQLVKDDLSKAEAFYKCLEPIFDLFDVELSKRALVNPVIPDDLKKALLDYALNRCDDGADPLIKNFISFVVESGRVAQLPGMISAFQTLLDEKRGVIKAEITTAVDINDQDIRTIADAIANKSRVDVKGTVDASILGGMIVRIGHDVVDMSLKRQLDLLAKV